MKVNTRVAGAKGAGVADPGPEGTKQGSALVPGHLPDHVAIEGAVEGELPASVPPPAAFPRNNASVSPPKPDDVSRSIRPTAHHLDGLPAELQQRIVRNLAPRQIADVENKLYGPSKAPLFWEHIEQTLRSALGASVPRTVGVREILFGGLSEQMLQHIGLQQRQDVYRLLPQLAPDVPLLRQVTTSDVLRLELYERFLGVLYEHLPHTAYTGSFGETAEARAALEDFSRLTAMLATKAQSAVADRWIYPSDAACRLSKMMSAELCRIFREVHDEALSILLLEQSTAAQESHAQQIETRAAALLAREPTVRSIALDLARAEFGYDHQSEEPLRLI